jgi:hypothetical protein
MQSVLGMGAEGIYYWQGKEDRTNIGQVLEFSGRSLVVVVGSSANIAGLIKS